ncbi:prepilin peptidase [Streptomyces chromofuscus]|uniref:Prepilin peptidase n=1 Tax=Streptomyces chromofuscus TaxID=42881 RepID=A0A7M2T3Q1_STRCW|nr:A24 family peptidase [Streptomyces chromofuscus]QOV42308.1 prepilin peptidase [Streptomyces chromofuscus]GGT34464.1 prepilin peptidase [Streptomyces chromofuscus]
MGEELLVAAAAAWGAGTGASLPRAAYRLSVPHAAADTAASEDAPPGEGPAWRDACPAGHPIAGPFRGWLGRARCRACPRPRYGPSALPLAILTAVLCAALAAATGPCPELGVWLLITPVGVLLAVVDVRVRRLPDPLTLPLAAGTLALLAVAAQVPGNDGDWSAALLGALALSGFYQLLCLVNPGGMGFGDVKLAVGAGAVLGWYGWGAVLLGTFAAFASGAVYGGALVVLRKAGRKTAIPFGPFLLAGACAGLLLGATA